MNPASVPASLERRPERADDEPFLASLFATVQPTPLLQLDPTLRDALVRHQHAGQAMTYRARYPDGRFELVECSGLPVGRVVTGLSKEALTLVDLAFLPAWRGRGLGTALIRALQDEARAAGTEMRLTVMAGNDAALRLYLRLGFRIAARSETDLTLRWRP
ncbi:MAG: GNAT family N-acetyltransferase [Janthinobacterium lividum]